MDPSRPGTARDFVAPLPAWMDPERASKRKQVPTLTLLLQTSDGGATWESSHGSSVRIGEQRRFTGPEGLIVMGFNESFQWPSEVYRMADKETRPCVSR